MHNDATQDTRDNSTIRIGEMFFKARDYTPIPLIILLLIFADPSTLSVTVGMLLTMFGELIRIYSVAFIGSISRTRKDRTGGSLITSGPFGYVRNPLYVGNFFISFGLAVYSGNVYIALLTAIMFAVQYYFIVSYEENLLRATFGAEYQAYCEEVPPWVPRKAIRLEDMQWPDSFSGALKSERKTLMAIGAVLLCLVLVG